MEQNVNEAAAIFEAGAVTLQGATEEFGIGRSALYDEMNAGRLEFAQRGRRRLIPRKALQRILAEDLVQPANHA